MLACLKELHLLHGSNRLASGQDRLEHGRFDLQSTMIIGKRTEHHAGRFRCLCANLLDACAVTTAQLVHVSLD